MKNLLAGLGCVLVMAVGASMVVGEDYPHRLVLPSKMEVVSDVPVKQHFKSAFLEETTPKGRVEVEGPVGRMDEQSGVWSFDEGKDGEGEFDLTVRLQGGDDLVLDEKRVHVRVVPKDAGAGRDITLLFVGDSLTHASLYPNEVARLLSRPGNPGWRMLGLHRPKAAAPGVAHEGYGGWTWKRFNTLQNEKPAGSKDGSSPFVFAGEDGKPVLDVERYFRERADGRIPDFVVFFLGINDCFSADSGDPAAIDRKIDEMMDEAEKLLAEFRKAAPNATFGLCLTPEANARESAFQSNYNGKYPRDGWRRIQFRLVERQLEQFGNRESEGIYIIPTSLVVDPVSGYPADNAVHPNKDGYESIGRAVYAWIKGRLAEK